MTLFFNNAVDTSYNTLGNFWEDAEFTVPASALPTVGDDVVAGELTGGAGTLNCLSVSFWGAGGNSATINGRGNFSTASFNTGTINGFGDFSDASSNNGVINGDAAFSNGAVNAGPVSGDAYFNASYNYSGGTVGGVATFIDASRNDGEITTAVFRSGSSNTNSVEEASFYDNSFNDSLVSGTAHFYDSSYCNSGGNVSGEAIFHSVGAIVETFSRSLNGIVTISLPAESGSLSDILGTGLL